MPHRRRHTALVRAALVPAALVAAALVGCTLVGCAQDRGQYAFAPPLAPPVYPQPPGYATPTVLPGPAPAPVAAVPTAVGPVPGALAGGVADPCAGAVVADGTVIEAPCPPGEVIVSGGVMTEGIVPTGATSATGPWVVGNGEVACPDGVIVP